MGLGVGVGGLQAGTGEREGSGREDVNSVKCIVLDGFLGASGILCVV